MLSTLFLLIAIFLYILYRNYYWIKRIPELCKVFVWQFLLGANHAGFIDRSLRLFEYYHPIGILHMGLLQYTIVSDPDTAELLLKKHLTRGEIYEYISPHVGGSLLTAPADLWKIHRKIINQSFSQNNLNIFMETFVKHSQILVEDLQKHQNIQLDIYPEFAKCTFRIICETTLGADDIEPHIQTEFTDLIRSGKELNGKRFLHPFLQFDVFWRLIGYARKDQELLTKADEYISDIIRDYKENKLNSNPKQFLSLLIESRDERSSWSNQVMLREIEDMIIAGSDTSALTSSFVIVMVAMHQDVQEKVYQEFFEIFGTSDRDVTLEDLDKLSYFDRVIKETMRLFPVVPVVFRKVQEDVKLDNYVIKNGTDFLVPIIYMHRNPIYWSNPMKFDPDRFLEEEVAKRPRYSFMPFSVPTRNCIGLQFAAMSVKVMVLTVLRHFKVYTNQYDSVASVRLSYHLFLAATDGHGVTLVPREI